ncbi:hypothetical protein AgCh_005891 [Apium graveolens]
MGKLNISLFALPEQIRPELPTPLLMPVTKTKGEIEARIQQPRDAKSKSKESVQVGQSSSAQVDVGKERLLRAAKVPNQDQEFNDLLAALMVSLQQNYMAYKKSLVKNINFIRAVVVKVDNFLEKRIVMNINDGVVDRCLQNKKQEDVEMIRILNRYLVNVDTILLNTQYDLRKDEDDNEQKDDKQKSSGSNPSEASKAAEPQQPSKSTISNIKPPQTSKPKFLYKQTANFYLKIPITTSQTSLKKISTLPYVKPSHKTHFKSVGRKPKKAKPTKKVEVTERAIWNCFKQNDFLSLNWCSSDEDYFQQLTEEIVRVWVVTLKEVRIYFQDGTFTFLGSNLMDTLSPTELKRAISLLKDKDTAIRAWRSVLAEWLIAREERRARGIEEYEEKRRKFDEEIEMYIKRSEELKAKGMSKISKDGIFLNVKTGSFSKFRIEMLDGYPK